jgi:hypothetical protein
MFRVSQLLQLVGTEESGRSCSCDEGRSCNEHDLDSERCMLAILCARRKRRRKYCRRWQAIANGKLQAFAQKRRHGHRKRFIF